MGWSKMLSPLSKTEMTPLQHTVLVYTVIGVLYTYMLGRKRIIAPLRSGREKGPGSRCLIETVTR